MSCGIEDDIEDILKKEANGVSSHLMDPAEADDFNRTANKSYIVPKSFKTKHLVDKVDECESSVVGNAPGAASIFVKTWGCTHNSSDSEYMAGQLASYGYRLVGKCANYKMLISLILTHLFLNRESRRSRLVAVEQLHG
jgi:hypothetical protein